MTRGGDSDDGSSADHVEYGLEDWSDDPMNEDGESSTLASVFGNDEGESTTRYSPDDPGRDLATSVLAGAVVGAVVSVLLPMIGTALGGALAGNLRARGELQGAKVGRSRG